MDTLRGAFGDYSEADAYTPDIDDACEDEIGREAPPPSIGQDERRMQVRAYNHWASLLGDRPLPLIADLETGQLPDFDPWSVLLDFTGGIDRPPVRYLGAALAAECDVDVATIRTLADVPGRSLLSRITDHYMQILANQAPIGFEAEFVNQRGHTVLYRGILLPFSASLDSTSIDLIYGVINWKELADQQTTDELMLAIDQVLAGKPARERQPLTTWADGPADGSDADVFDLGPLHAEDPALGWSAIEDGAEAALADLLASARELARAAQGSEDRSRHALYAAIGRAYDFALAARTLPEDFAELVADAGLTMQERAPLMPLVKLVFGADYDKTRLTEFTTALGHAQRLGLAPGMLAGFLGSQPGGLKGVVHAERALRREESGKIAAPPSPRAAMTARLRALPTRPLADLAAEGEEFTLVLARRTDAGEIVLVGEVGDDAALLERAAKKLLG